jgi:type III pantothenate kinase
MLLVLDIGNSTVTAGIFFGEALRTFSMPSSLESTVDDLTRALGAQAKEIDGVALSSVVPALTTLVVKAIEKLTGIVPHILTHDNSLMAFNVDDPSTVGADRIASAIGAVELFGSPLAVVDFGTATTVGFISGSREHAVFEGGAILPGLSLMSDSLVRGTAQLPSVAFDKEARVVGKDTAGNILSGIIYGTVGAVERIIEGGDPEGKYKVVVTGGNMRHLVPIMNRFDFEEPALILRGLRVYYERMSV